MDTGVLIDARTFLGNVWKLTTPYWRSEEKWRAWGLLAAIVTLSLSTVYLLVLLNDWNRQFFNALEQKDERDFFVLLVYFCFLAALYIVAVVYETYLEQMLQMRWRIWLTKQYLDDWLGNQVYYRLELESRGTDNPDQRIAEDLRLFTSGTLGLALGLMREGVTLASFAVILWNLSGALPMTIGGTAISIPGYLLWAALVYAVVGSVLAHYVGRRLIGLNFMQERYEADFRYTLVRLRENAEGIALYRGEAPEKTVLLDRIEWIRGNWWELMRYTKRLNSFTVGYNQIAVVFPYFVAGHRYFSGAVPLGGLTQIASAFGQVQSSLSWFVNNYSTLANWKASVDRLLTFHRALEDAAAEQARHGGIDVREDGGRAVRAEQLDLALPNGRTILADTTLEIEPGERLLVAGPSGAGKSTLFRALAGIWPFGRGRIRIPQGARVLFLPQKPYIPIASLRDAVAYPGQPGEFPDEAVRAALADVGLGAFAARLDERDNWSMRLSGGEQQRLAIARALLHAPDWLFLDEATASLDEAAERRLYELLTARLPRAAIVSIAHRPAVAAFHARRVTFVPEAEGMALASA
ncbi:MAG TPA: ABC transporter ATP-binding protein/permease [Burkholderiales bacterium]|nr:ABC transporter ATP-binding protein/permease [Burkholderiales bacterium]